jgi:hypothetical protein
VDATLVRKLCNDLLAGAAASLSDPPERQFVAHGDFAHDCELLAVRTVSIRTEAPDLHLGGAGCSVIPIVTLQLVLLRCYPTMDGPEPPAPAALTAASLQLADDAVGLSGGILDRWSAGTLFPTALIHCDKVQIGILDPIGPLGGIAGWRISYEVRT